MPNPNPQPHRSMLPLLARLICNEKERRKRAEKVWWLWVLGMKREGREKSYERERERERELELFNKK